MRVFIDCTHIFEHPDYHTGVQRVIRNIAYNSDTISQINAVPVILENTEIYDASRLPHFDQNKRTAWITTLIVYLIRTSERFWGFYERFQEHQSNNKPSKSGRLFLLLFQLACKPITLPLRLLKIARSRGIKGNLITDIQPDDVLLWLDPSFGNKEYYQLSRLKLKGIRIVAVIYDLFPLKMPDLFPDEALPKMEQLICLANGILTISATVKNELQEYMADHLQNQPWLDYFYLSAKLDMAGHKKSVRPVLKNVFETNSSVYLMLGTLYRHKNHIYALEAFELLWANNVDVTLCIVGKIAWNATALADRIKNHPERNKRLFMWNDLDDAEVKYCYTHSKALVFPSSAEGFGLPLIEAMEYGLPVMASDIPIFREIGQDFVAFFDLSRPQNLYDLIAEYEKTSIFPALIPVSEWKWISWQESTEQLIDGVVRNEALSTISQQNTAKENFNGRNDASFY